MPTVTSGDSAGITAAVEHPDPAGAPSHRPHRRPPVHLDRPGPAARLPPRPLRARPPRRRAAHRAGRALPRDRRRRRARTLSTPGPSSPPSSPPTTCWRSAATTCSPNAASNCPGDLSVTGFNDMPIIDRLRPSLTSVHVPHYEIGAEACAAAARAGGRGRPAGEVGAAPGVAGRTLIDGAAARLPTPSVEWTTRRASQRQHRAQPEDVVVGHGEVVVRFSTARSASIPGARGAPGPVVEREPKRCPPVARPQRLLARAGRCDADRGGAPSTERPVTSHQIERHGSYGVTTVPSVPAPTGMPSSSIRRSGGAANPSSANEGQPPPGPQRVPPPGRPAGPAPRCRPRAGPAGAGSAHPPRRRAPARHRRPASGVSRSAASHVEDGADGLVADRVRVRRPAAPQQAARVTASRVTAAAAVAGRGRRPSRRRRAR